jgi:hypothetical protein
MPTLSYLPEIPRFELGSHPSPRSSIKFPSDSPETTLWSGVSAEAMLEAITSDRFMQEATGLDRQGLLRRLSVKWTPDAALKNCK